MPNFHTAQLKPLNYPCTSGQSSFIFEATSTRGNRLVMARIEDSEPLLIRVNSKAEGGYLVKGDKITRPTEASFLQKVLMDFRDVSGAQVTHSNIEPKKFLHVKHSSLDSMRSADGQVKSLG